jgi:4-diphosphocytidyl-2-C-methyl-D-erythritol kinase
MTQTVLSPAKVNLFLKVLSKRADGYHNLKSMVDVISLYDIIHIDDEPGGKVHVKDDKGILPDGEGNTMYRAALLLKETFGIREGAGIFVEKHIPIGSGLGGPSSNAAAVLKALVGRWKLSVPEDQLMDLGKRIGADVPLFLHGSSCIMEGIGEKITPVTLPALAYVIVYPDVIISTREVYSRLRISLTKGENGIKLRSGFGTAREIAALLENDLEQVGIPMCPKIQTVKDRLIEAGAVGSLMSGSGSSVFGLFESIEEAEKASVLLRGMGSVFVAHSVQEGRYGYNGCEDISCKREKSESLCIDHI